MYVKLTDGIPEKYSVRALRKANPNTSFPEDPTDDLLAEWGLYPYVHIAEPVHDSTAQVVEHNGYTETDGIYGDAYIVRDKTADELSADLADWRTKAYVSRFQFCETLAATGILPKLEAIAAAKGEWPETFATALSGLTTDQGFGAQLEWATAATIRRDHPTITMLAAPDNANLTPEQVDALFGWVE